MHALQRGGKLLLAFWALSACSLFSAPQARLTLHAGVALEQARAFRLPEDAVRRQLVHMASAPHPFGSPAQAHLAVWFVQALQAAGLRAQMQEFSSTVPNPARQPLTLRRQGRNIMASAQLTEEPRCQVILGSHYDTKDIPGMAYLGANDSASSALLLLQMMAYLQAHKKDLPALTCDVMAVWFDGEEAVLPAWDDGERSHPAHLVDHTYGSRHFVASLPACPKGTRGRCVASAHAATGKPLPIKAMILVDMVGTKNLRLTNDISSTPQLWQLLTQAGKDLGLEAHVATSDKQSIADDHHAFLSADIPAINLIDFHDLTHWHRASDVASEVSVDSMEKAGKLALYMALHLAGE